MATDSNGKRIETLDWVKLNVNLGAPEQQPVIVRITMLTETVKVIKARGAFIDSDGTKTLTPFDPSECELVMRADGGV